MGKYALILCAWALAGCGPRCGAGTHEVTGADGARECVADYPNGIACDADGGTVEIVDGVCESRVRCADPLFFDPGTGLCIDPELVYCGSFPCPAPIPPGMVCVTGGVVDFETGQHLVGANRPLRIAIYDGASLGIVGPPESGLPLDKIDSSGACFTFLVPAPAAGLLLVTTSDPVDATPLIPLAHTGTLAAVVGGAKYALDAYIATKSTVDGWAAIDARFSSQGSFASCFYNQAPPAVTNVTFTETMPSAGVALREDGNAPSLVRYLGANAAIDSSLAATGVKGCALSIGTGGFNQYGGSGGGIAKWETKPGATVQNYLIVERLHSCDNAPAGPTCQ